MLIRSWNKDEGKFKRLASTAATHGEWEETRRTGDVTDSAWGRRRVSEVTRE